jgi:hypothetical protein
LIIVISIVEIAAGQEQVPFFARGLEAQEHVQQAETVLRKLRIVVGGVEEVAAIVVL